MICAVIPTYNAAAHLPKVMGQLQGKAARIVAADGGSTDKTLPTAISYGAVIAAGVTGRGQQLALGAKAAGEVDWFLFIHADNELPANWNAAVEVHIAGHPDSAGYFRFRANAKGFWPRFMDFWVGMRCQWWGLPYGDQGLLISRAMYEAVGGYPPQILFEDVAIVDAIKSKIGRTKLRPLKGHMRINISNYSREGVWQRGRRNLALLKAYRRGADVTVLAKRYQAYK